MRDPTADVIAEDTIRNGDEATVCKDATHRAARQTERSGTGDAAALEIVVSITTHYATCHVERATKTVKNTSATSAIVAARDRQAGYVDGATVQNIEDAELRGSPCRAALHRQQIRTRPIDRH